MKGYNLASLKAQGQASGFSITEIVRQVTNALLTDEGLRSNVGKGRHVCIRFAMPKVSNQILLRTVRCNRLVKIDESGWSLS
jgi:nucleoside-triphosphatase THEP1